MKTRFTSVLILLFLGCLYSSSYGQRDHLLKATQVNGKWGYADPTGKVVIRAVYDRALPFKDNMAKVAVRDPNVTEDLGDLSFLWGMIDSTGRLFVPTQYNYLRDY